MSLEPMQEWERPFFDTRMHACPMRTHSTSFQLVDEEGDGAPYAGLAYEATDYEGAIYLGILDETGTGKVNRHYCGPVVLKVDQAYQGLEDIYTALSGREHYPLPITELQVRAEKTRFLNSNGTRTQSNPAQAQAGFFCQVEVSELVAHRAHLPPLAPRNFAPQHYVHSLMRQPSEVAAMAELGFGPTPSKVQGIALLPNKHHVLEVRPLRALSPVLSTGNEFCSLNLYQLALMATLSYSPFGQDPNSQPVESSSVSFPAQPSVGNWFGDALAKSDELWQVDASQIPGKTYYPLYADVAYSKRLEVVPFDPKLYPDVNSPDLGTNQEHPAKLHYLDDADMPGGTDSQAFITHNDELVLLAIRGTAGGPDILRDLDAAQVPFENTSGKVHNGFYGSAKVVREFVTTYLDKFYSGQKLVITGHSLGGAVALLVAEMLRRNKKYAADILLYTYGSPRAGDKTFVENAKALVHHRMVNQNDPVPSVPAAWMDTSWGMSGLGVVLTFVNVPVGLATLILSPVNIRGEPYTHHGKLRHFMPVSFRDGDRSAILWEPGCETVTEHAGAVCAKALKAEGGLPDRGRLLRQMLDYVDHKMVASYIPHCWAFLRRSQEALESRWPLVTSREVEQIDQALNAITVQMREEAAQADNSAGQFKVSALQAEMDKVKETRLRLRTLSDGYVTDAQVYGLLVNQPDVLAMSLERWLAHSFNRVREQLAMAPSDADSNDHAIAALVGGHVPGAAFDLNVDGII
ncbi:lipase family protein [Pseudomonas sp. SK3(2021)]|uniref:lipase family protein n=1 Tax=Pseudomonas sp. SK3(2021) TaxID=2841064 RepID=UPI00192C53BA|nr:lipase family protein [Pseudomonas sp. SK3(2021)]QQZ39808.1 lipase family protein [Pseudomonas sp. SK3(2021)]